VPLSLKVFLTALAIADDLAAILVIALFYGGTVAWPYLFAAFILLAILAIANYYDVQQVPLYAVLGIIIWYLFLQSGVHATIAGVLIAMTVPARTKLHARNFIPKVKWRLRKFANIPTEGQSFLLDDDQLNAINDIEIIMQEVQSPLQKMEHRLSGVVNYFILPLFALSNAGVVLMASGSSLASITEVFTALSLIIAASLIFGKVIGISVFSWLAVKFKLAVKPEKVSWLSYIGLGFLGGIGFTMSIFIATLAFDDPALQDQAKIGIFVGSIISGIAGFFLLKYSLRPKAKIKK
ncbi:MAG TPA: Na+/H+ antiporter NhaA, partial [Marinilabiliaceae bacterium]|nr:Na+/H+ antiporter NhaA [Marinilabiliaceae bacterium]